jgi:hypothetical protein
MLDKAIQSGKEKRKPYWGAKSFDRSCRPNGGCGYCEDSRKYAVNRDSEKSLSILDEQLEEIELDISSLTVRI